MDRIYYNIEEREFIINYPVDALGHYMVEWNGIEIGHLYIEDKPQNLGCIIWKGTTNDVDLFAEKLGAFIEGSKL